MRDWPWQRFVILGVILLVVFYFLFFKPKNAQLKSVKAERATAETELEKLRVKKNQLDRIESEMVNLNKTLKELETIIPQKKETSEILLNIHQLATNSRLNIDKFIPKGDIDRDYYYEWQISIEAIGNYHNLATFYDRLSRFSRLFTIDNFSIRSIPNQTESSTISATFIAKTYIFREEGAAAKEKKGKKVGKK